MLSYPDFEEKQIIIVESYDVKNLFIKNSNLASKDGVEIVNQVPLSKIFAVFVVGEVTFTSVLLKKLSQNGIMIVFMAKNYLTYCVLGGETEGNTLLREKQYFDEQKLMKAKWVILNKIRNQIILLKKRRNKTKDDKVNLIRLSVLLDKVYVVQNFKELLGIEGNTSKIFFQRFYGKFNWNGRKPRSKFDEINTLLDIGYTYLFNFIEANLRLYGFDIYRGFYHTDFYQRKSLVCDLQEPFRCIIDNALYKMLVLKKFNSNDFVVRKGEYHINNGCGVKYIKYFVEEIMKNKKDIFIYIQSFYRNFMRGDVDYPIFLIK